MDIKLIDYFAARALEGITSHPEGFNCPAEDAAAVAYKYAVAMMQEREEVQIHYRNVRLSDFDSGGGSHDAKETYQRSTPKRD
jgi:hypothetical protein